MKIVITLKRIFISLFMNIGNIFKLVIRLIKSFSIKRMIIFAVFIFFVFSTLFLIGINIYINNYSEKYIHQNLKDVPSSKVVLVLGASVYSDGQLSNILEDRVLAALELYVQGKVDKFILSGDHGTEYYDEVTNMKNYLVKKNVDSADLFLDHAGFNTYDSLYRAVSIFGADEMLIVTQEYHLPRAVYIARSLGINAFGYVADKREYLQMTKYKSREVLANVKAFLSVLFNSKPRYLGPRISLNDDGKISWD